MSFTSQNYPGFLDPTHMRKRNKKTAALRRKRQTNYGGMCCLCSLILSVFLVASGRSLCWTCSFTRRAISKHRPGFGTLVGQTTATSFRFLQRLQQSNNDIDNQEEDSSSMESDIDSFLRGDYDQPFASDAPFPQPGMSPRSTIEVVLQSVRHMNKPTTNHGAAVLQRFCAPLSRGERWGLSQTSDPWKEVLRGALTPSMLAKRLRASVFSLLLDWTKLDVTEGYSMQKGGIPTVSFVNAALYFEKGAEPAIVQFTLQRIGEIWLINTAKISEKELFMQEPSDIRDGNMS